MAESVNSPLLCGDKQLDLSCPQVMGILNVTPDSFSDGGAFVDLDAALAHALQMAADGATVIDVGGESTRPGAEPVGSGQEMDRVLPVVERLSQESDVVVSVDTSTPEVMREAARAGAGLINDVRALGRPDALSAVRESGLPVCLMHMRGEPSFMQKDPSYSDVLGDVQTFLARRIAVCEQAGIPRERILVDPGFGFGKTLEHNLKLLRELDKLLLLGCPLLVGVSRKSMIGAVLDKQVDERLYGGLAASVMALERGARIIRTHDVGPVVDAIGMVSAVLAS